MKQPGYAVLAIFWISLLFTPLGLFAQGNILSTSFEFNSSTSFSLFDPPFNVTFNGGSTRTVGMPGLYRTGRFSWGTTIGSDTLEIVFNRPAENVQMFWRGQSAGDLATAEIIDTDGTVVVTANATTTFTALEYNAAGGPGVARVRIVQTAGSTPIWVDDFLYLPREDMAPAFLINPGLNGSWFNAATSGQGIFIDVFPDIPLVFMAWFTYDTSQAPDGATAVVGDPNHRWVTAQGPFADDTADLQITLTTGGLFDDPAPTSNQSVGTITLRFTDCSNGTLEYNFPDLGLSGSIPLTRIANDNVALCETIASGGTVQ